MGNGYENRIRGYGLEAPDQLLANPNNWRGHPTLQRETLDAVLREVGWVVPVIVNVSTGHVVDGHLRVDLAMQKGIQEIPVVYVELTPEEEAEALATMDPMSAMAFTDKPILERLMADFTTESSQVNRLLQDLLGKEPPKQNTYNDSSGDAPETYGAEEAASKWGVVKGDIFQAGPHRIMCGDSASPEDVARLMDGHKAMLLATDPPYGISVDQGKNLVRDMGKAPRRKAIAGDQRQGEALSSWIAEVLEAWFPHVERDSGFYLWAPPLEQGFDILHGMLRAGLRVSSQIIWKKNFLVLGQSDYQWIHEVCWYGYFLGAKHRWYGGRDKTTVWDVDREATTAYKHPTQKPIALWSRPIEHHTSKGDVIAEPFAGSGSQIVAAHLAGRACYAMELDPGYVAMILERLSGLGLTPERVT